MKWKVLFDAIFILSVSLSFTFLPAKVSDSFNRLIEFAFKGQQSIKILPHQVRFVGIVGILVGLLFMLKARN